MTELDTTPALTLREAKHALSQAIAQVVQRFENANPELIVTDISVQRDMSYAGVNRLSSVDVTVEVR